jgi:serine/threonine protein kinase
VPPIYIQTVAMHLDLKPENMMYFCQPNGEMVLKAIDFGSSKLLGTSHGPENRANLCKDIDYFVGSKEYISPEIRYKVTDLSWEASAEFLSNEHPLKVNKTIILEETQNFASSPEEIQNFTALTGKRKKNHNISIFSTAHS